MPHKPLVDDCFQHARGLLLHDDAISLLKSRLSGIVGTEEIPIAAAGGRILAAEVRARFPVPAHTNAAVDGYAFAFEDYDRTSGAVLPVVGRAAAGRSLVGPPSRPGAVRIFTGAAMPAGLDTAAMQEDCTDLESGGLAQVRIPAGLEARANVRQAGEDVAANSKLFEPGDVVRPQDLAALASIGASEVACFRRLRVAVVSTGDEIVRAGSRPLAAGEVYDANAPMLAALGAHAGAEVAELGIWPDRPAVVREALAAAVRDCDVILTTGGASRGEEDHMAAAIADMGSRHFWQIAVKPGRPMMFGQIGATPVVGLPGNPVAVFVCFLMYVFPMLRVLGGGRWPEPRRYPLPAAFAWPERKPGRREFWRGMLVDTPTGLAVDKFMRDGSGLISGLRAADGLIDIPETVPAVRPGDTIAFIPFSEFGIVGR